MAPFFAKLFSPRPRAALSQHGIENVEYADSRVREGKLRSFENVVKLDRFTPRELELTYRSSGLIFKGVNRKARDALKKGFVLVPDDGDRDTADELNAAVRAWMRETGYKGKAIRALREMFVFGDGFLEIAYDDKGAANTAPPKNARPVAAFNVDPLTILPVRNPKTDGVAWYLSGPQVRTTDRNLIKRWMVGATGASLPRNVKVIHPSRIQHFQVNTLRDHPDKLGISIIEAAYLNLIAKLAGDLSAGDVLEWYSKGFFVVKADGADPEELKALRKLVDESKAARKNYFVGSERHEFDIKSPLLANLKPYYEQFYIEFAAALEMPVMVLLGVQKGTVTGSEVDLLDYYDEVLAFQELLLEKPVYDLMARVLRRTDFIVEWTPLFVNKQTEADIRFKDAQSTAQLFGANVLGRRDAIRYLRDGILPDPEDVPDGFSEVASPDTRPGSPAGPAPPVRAAPRDDAEDDDESHFGGDLVPQLVGLSDDDRAQIERERSLGEAALRDGKAV